MTNLALDYERYEYLEFQDPTSDDIAKAISDGFHTITSKVINLPEQPDGRKLTIKTVLLRRDRG